MEKQKITCDNCGAADVKIENNYAICQYFGTKFLIPDRTQPVIDTSNCKTAN